MRLHLSMTGTRRNKGVAWILTWSKKEVEQDDFATRNFTRAQLLTQATSRRVSGRLPFKHQTFDRTFRLLPKP